MACKIQDKSLITDEAADYVDTIMSTQRVMRVGTPMTRRKRNRSAPSPILFSNSKRARNSSSNPGTPKSEDNASPSQAQTSRRALYKETEPTPTSRRNIGKGKRKADFDPEVAMEKLIDRLSVDISNRFSELNDRIDRLEQGLEQKISNKVAQILDKRINSEMKRIRKDIDVHIETVTDSIKAEVAADIADLSKKIESAGSNTDPTTDISCNIVIRNLQETENENVKDKVLTLIKEGCGVRDVSISAVERKRGQQRKPGVVIVKFSSRDDKRSVMVNKRKLKNSRRFQNVYIQHDQTRTDRLIADNFRTMLAAMKRGDNDISLRGTRVVRGNDSSYAQVTNDTRRSDDNNESRNNRGRHNRNAAYTRRGDQYQRRH